MNLMIDPQTCERCGDDVLTLSSRGWCDGCEEENPVTDADQEPARRAHPCPDGITRHTTAITLDCHRCHPELHIDCGGKSRPEPVSNDVYTRRLIVTLPDVSGEEADSVASHLEDELTEGFTIVGTVTHALGESLPVHVRLKIGDGLHGQRVYVLDGAGNATHTLEPLEARQFAGALLAHAHTIDGK